ncbi:hypothetical protein DRO51_01500 [Candidatus Bathyarchaeota archaeon]|nr:MAG: hypothetical protein DRO51_01500 [Candidatus Bathyarchaeota archaeon]
MESIEKKIEKLSELVNNLLETVVLTLKYVDDYCRKNNIPLLNDDRITYLVRETLRLIEELNEEAHSPPKRQHRFRTPPDSTEP